MAQSQITGLFQYLLWGTVTPTSGTGVITGGDLSVNPDARQRLGIGGQEIRRGGLCSFAGQAELLVSEQNQALVALGLRASYPRGALTSFMIEGGADEWGRQYTSAVMEELRLTYAQGEAFKAGLSWGALGIAATSGNTQAAETNLDFEDYDFTVLVLGAEYSVQSFNVSVNNGVMWRTSGDAKTATQKRWPQYYLMGPEVLTCELTTAIPLPSATLDFWDDTLPSNLTASLTGSNGINTLTLSLTNLQPAGAERMGFVGNETEVGWTYSFRGSSASGSLSWGWA